MIVVIDSGTGNLRSVIRALHRVGAEAMISTDAADVEAADKILLPGVGSAAAAMKTLQQHRLIDVLNRKVLDQKTPVLGICLGFQLLVGASDEGEVKTLGWIEGRTMQLQPTAAEPGLKVPQLGWNTVAQRRPSPLFEGLSEDACFYFAHSYCVQCERPHVVVAETTYGERFVSGVWSENIFGVQFHPEKSQANGLTVLRNFVNYC